MPDNLLGLGYLKDFYRIIREENAAVRLSIVSSSTSFEYGLSRIVKDIIDGTLIIPDNSNIYKQLHSITSHSLKHSPEKSFYAINALSHIVSSFDKYP